MRGSSVPSTSVGSPGTFTPRGRNLSNASTALSNEKNAGNKGNANAAAKPARTYEEYLPLCEMQKGLEKGEIVEVSSR